MRLTTQIFFILVLITDIINKIVHGETEFFGYGEICVLAFMLFIVFGDKISKFILNKDGFTIEQNIEEQVSSAEKDLRTISKLEKGTKINEIDNLLSHTTGQNRDVWSKMIIFRLSMRVLLRKVCSINGMTLRDTTAFVEMIKYLKEKKVLPFSLEKDIEFVRDQTFFFEWGTGNTPKVEDIKRTLIIAPRVLREIEMLISF